MNTRITGMEVFLSFAIVLILIVSFVMSAKGETADAIFALAVAIYFDIQVNHMTMKRHLEDAKQEVLNAIRSQKG